jgi:hypothetical protein
VNDTRADGARGVVRLRQQGLPGGGRAQESQQIKCRVADIRIGVDPLLLSDLLRLRIADGRQPHHKLLTGCAV